MEELPFRDLVARIAERTPAPGGGAVCASAAALGAAVVEMAARFADEDETAARAATLRAALLSVPDEDAAAYSAVLEASGAARDAALAVEGRPSLRGDAISGVLVAEGAARAAVELVRINLAAHAEDPRLDAAHAAAERAAAARTGALAR